MWGGAAKICPKPQRNNLHIDFQSLVTPSAVYAKGYEHFSTVSEGRRSTVFALTLLTKSPFNSHESTTKI